MLYAQYEQRTGLFRICEITEGGIERVVSEAKGYAGRGQHRDNPNSQHLMTWGPLPRGGYRIKPPVTHRYLGPVCLYLEPHRGTDTFGRSGFAIHGDNSRGDFSASHGCIILPRSMRSDLVKRGVRYLEVVAGASNPAKPGTRT